MPGGDHATAIGLFLLAPRVRLAVAHSHQHMSAAPIGTRGPQVGTPAPFRLVGGYLVASLVCWLIAAAALLQAAPDIAHAAFASPAMLLAVHLLALGFLPLAVTGAVLHVLPTVLRASSSSRLGWVGLIGLCGGPFLAVGISRHQPALTWAAATLVGLGACLILLHVGLLVARAPHNRLLLASRIGIASASGNALLAFLLGPVLFVREWQPWLGIPHERLIAIHLHLAAIGWLTLLIVAVGRTLVPMLALTPSEPARRLPLAELSLIAGLWLAIAGFIVGDRTLLLAGYATTVAALAHFATVLLRAARRSRREAIEGPIAHVLTGLVCLCEAAVLAGLLLSRSDNGGVLSAYALLLLLGWAAGITLGHVGKLLSLSAWAWWPPGPRPKQAALYARGLWVIEAAAFALGVQLLAAAALVGNPALARAGAALLVISALLALGAAAHTLRHGQPALRR